VLLAALSACGPSEDPALDDDLGDVTFEPAPAPPAADAALGTNAIKVDTDTSRTDVWTVRNFWSDKDTTEARKSGLAWGASSGLTWNEKFARWIDQMQPVESDRGYRTFKVTTPYGKTLNAPNLECAETAMFLRVAFASWYGLPFFMEARDSSGVKNWLGHFGWRTSSGRYPKSPEFKVAYKDYTSTWSSGQAWPRDTTLRARRLGDDDENAFLGTGLGAGAYFDEIFLNKRAGYLTRLLLLYFGSVHLASYANTFNIKPEAIRTGDVLLERWQRVGIGHTLIVKEVAWRADGLLDVELASGSMPRRQPKWDDAVGSRDYLTSDITGGVGEDDEGNEFWKLGGGIKRWRIAARISGYWKNAVPLADRGVWVSHDDAVAISSRPARFDEILATADPADRRAALVRNIEDARAHLRRYPASCSARIKREQLFDELAYVNEQYFRTSRLQTERQYRRFEDFVFQELDYSGSKTCCWNGTTADMYQIVMAYNEAQRNASQSCVAPAVFRATGGGDYAVFRNYAQQTGRSAQWKAWSEDEPCPQRAVAEDRLVAPHGGITYCGLGVRAP
jgi:hypothetical protein